MTSANFFKSQSNKRRRKNMINRKNKKLKQALHAKIKEMANGVI